MGTPEVVVDGENGFLIPPRNKDILNDKISILINNVPLREKFAKRSVKIIRNEFNIDKKVNELIELYSKELKYKKF